MTSGTFCLFYSKRKRDIGFSSNVELGPNHKIQNRLPVYFIQTIVGFIWFGKNSEISYCYRNLFTILTPECKKYAFLAFFSLSMIQII